MLRKIINIVRVQILGLMIFWKKTADKDSKFGKLFLKNRLNKRKLDNFFDERGSQFSGLNLKLRLRNI